MSNKQKYQNQRTASAITLCNIIICTSTYASSEQYQHIGICSIEEENSANSISLNSISLSGSDDGEIHYLSPIPPDSLSGTISFDPYTDYTLNISISGGEETENSQDNISELTDSTPRSSPTIPEVSADSALIIYDEYDNYNLQFEDFFSLTGSGQSERSDYDSTLTTQEEIHNNPNNPHFQYNYNQVMLELKQRLQQKPLESQHNKVTKQSSHIFDEEEIDDTENYDFPTKKPEISNAQIVEQHTITSKALHSIVTDGIMDTIDSAINSGISSIFVPIPNIAIAAGDDTHFRKKRIWTKGFMGISKLRGTKGFKANSAGEIIGTDVDIEDKLMLGVALTNASAKANVYSTKIKVNSDVASIYYSYDFSTSTTVSGNISYGLLKINGLEKGVKSNNGNLVKNSITVTKSIKIHDDSLIVRPKAGLSYNTIRLYYNNSGIDSSNFSGDIALDISKTFNVSNNFSITSSIHVGIKHLLKQTKDKVNITNAYNETTDIYNKSPYPNNLYNIGSYINIAKNNSMNFGFAYNLNFRSKYKAHSGFIQLELVLQ